MRQGMQALPKDEWTQAMLRGDFARAWEISDRILADKIARRAFDYTLPRHMQTIWDGRSLAGKHVLVRCYHGLGDTVQFIRFIKPLRTIAREVSLWVQPALMPLVARVEGVERVLPLSDGVPDLTYEADIEIMELAHALRVMPGMLAADIPYIHAAPRALTPSDRIRVGLIWSAGDWDSRRSMHFAELAPLLALPHIELIVLQRGPARLQAMDYQISDLGTDDIEDFASTLRALDLLVCVDTFGPHLAGAMNVPVWLMLQQDCDWRWMSEGDASSWYPSMRIFRQPAYGDWTSVVANITRALADLRSDRAIRPHATEQSHRCDVRTENVLTPAADNRFG
jgi:hypothetical protein